VLSRTTPNAGNKRVILGFGCMRLPLAEGNINEGRAVAQLRGAIDTGINDASTTLCVFLRV